MNRNPNETSGIAFARLTPQARGPLLDAHAAFWGDRDLRPLHQPVWFRQFADAGMLAVDGAVTAGYLLGAVTAGGIGYVHVIAVREEYRGQGLGRRLWGEFERRAREQWGAVRLEAVTTTGNTGSIAFHSALGMAVERVPDYSGPGVDRILFSKDLGR